MLFQFGENLTALYGKYEVPESHEEFEEVANEYLRNVGEHIILMSFWY